MFIRLATRVANYNRRAFIRWFTPFTTSPPLTEGCQIESNLLCNDSIYKIVRGLSLHLQLGGIVSKQRITLWHVSQQSLQLNGRPTGGGKQIRNQFNQMFKLKVAQIIPKVGQRVAQAVFLQKVMIKNCPKSHFTFWLLL